MRLLRLIFLALAMGWVFTMPARAVEPDEILTDKAMETRARDLSAELRCLVCQNQSIDDSQASLAKDLRMLVRQRLQAGDSDEQVRKYLVDRYGDFILLQPPFKLTTLLLWLTPGAVLLLGGLAIWGAQRQSRTSAAEAAALSGAEQAELEKLLKGS